MKKLILLKLAVYGALALAPLHDAKAADGIPYDSVGKIWTITAYQADKPGEAPSCAASAYYPDVGASLFLFLSTDQQAMFGVSSPAISKNLINGKSYTFNVFMNGVAYANIQTPVSGQNILFTANAQGLEDIAQARNVAIATGVLEIGNFNLKYSAAAIAKLKECVAVIRHGMQQQAAEPQAQEPQAQPEIEASDPQPMSATRSF